MQKRIAVILAASKNFRNTGMFSVDLAAYTFFKEHFPEASLTFYVMELGERKYYDQYEKLIPYDTYKEIEFSDAMEIYSSDLIVFWSDFFHNRSFLEEYMETYQFSKAKNDSELEEIKALFFDCYFLEKAHDNQLKKVVIFGNSLMPLNQADLLINDRYTKNVKRLYSNAYFVMPRDDVSTRNAKLLLNRTNAVTACDPAFLYEGYEVLYQENTLGLFIGRRTEISISNIISIVLYARNNNLRVEWIPWMINSESMLWRAITNPRQAKNLFLHLALSRIFKPNVKYEKSNLRFLSRHRVIVSDTYHLCINAISQGVPVFCVGSNSIIYGKNSKDLHDNKKIELFNRLGISHRYTDKKDLSEGLMNSMHEPFDSDWPELTDYANRVSDVRVFLKTICEKILNEEK